MKIIISFIAFFIVLVTNAQVLLLTKDMLVDDFETNSENYIGNCDKILKLKRTYCIDRDDAVKKSLGINENEFFSLATYWWPNPYTFDGLPYLAKDGKANPERLNVGDFENLKRLSKDIKILVANYISTDDNIVKEHLENLINIWFIDRDTKMSPNLLYAQTIKGRSKFRIEGTLEGMYLMEIMHYISMIEGKLDSVLIGDFKHWFFELSNWYLSDNIYKLAINTTNNIGTAYFMQVFYYCKFSGNTRFKDRIDEMYNIKVLALMKSQFSEDGSQSKELKRVKKTSYSISNLMYWCNIITILDLTENDDLYGIKNTVKLGLDYVLTNDDLEKGITTELSKYIHYINKMK